MSNVTCQRLNVRASEASQCQRSNVKGYFLSAMAAINIPGQEIPTGGFAISSKITMGRDFSNLDPTPLEMVRRRLSKIVVRAISNGATNPEKTHCPLLIY